MSPRSRAFRALRFPNFARFITARFLATLAVQMQSVAVGWQVYALTGDALDLGLIGLAQFLPFVALVLPAGQVADRHDRRLILALCFAVEVGCGLLLLAFTVSGLTVVWPVFLAMVLFGTARAFSMPAGQAFVPNLVPGEHLSNAVALNSSTFHVATIAGPTLGGIFYLAGPAFVYASVASPPMTTERTRPNQTAVTPDSNSPSSFDAPMNTALTALTRPRMPSGVSSWMSMCRM